MADIKFTGNVGKDAELKFLNSGRAVLNFSVADSKSRKLDNGEWETLSEQWLDCAIWGELAEFYADKIKRGTRVTVYGDFMSRKYEAKDGSKGTSLDVNVKGVDIMPSRKGGGGRNSDETAAATGSWGNAGGAQEDPWATPASQDPPF